jgi:hypothetical protein
LIFAEASHLKSAASVPSFFFFIINIINPLRPMDFKMANEGVHIVVPSEGATDPQEFGNLRN